jgi:uncharacterized protein (TIGR03118 family)
MRRNFLRHGFISAAALALAACGGSGYNGGGAQSAPSTGGPPSTYKVTNLVSDGAVPAAHTDANLKNPWGVVFNGGGPPLAPVWVANNGTNTSTLYDGTGTAVLLGLVPLVFDIPKGRNGDASPTGIVYNATSDFSISQGTGLGQPASFIFSGEGGTIAAWTTTNLLSAVTEYDDGAGGAVYKGLANAGNGKAHFLYATDFHNNKIDVFDKSFKKVSAPGGFVDPSLPAGYAPFGIQAIANKVYVTYAQQKAPDNHDEVDGAGLGFVDLFDADGNMLQRVVSGGPLNAPWGIALAPKDFGSFSNALLIGNFGDGVINAFNPANGAFLGSLSDASGKPIAFPGLWGICFGNDVMSQPHNTLFFAAGINDEADGLYGRIDLKK